MEFDYYYGSQAEQFSFYRLPKSLIKDKQFKRVSKDINKPMGISEYKLVDTISDELKASLPAIEEIESRIEKMDKK